MMGRQMRGPGWGLRANTGAGLRGPTGVGFVWGMADVCGARRILGTAPWVGPLQMRAPRHARLPAAAPAALPCSQRMGSGSGKCGSVVTCLSPVSSLGGRKRNGHLPT